MVEFELSYFSTRFNAFFFVIMLIFMINKLIKKMRNFCMEGGIKVAQILKYFAYLRVIHNFLFLLSIYICICFFLLLIDIDCDKGFKWYFSGFPISLMVFKLNLIAVKLVQEQTLFNLLLFYHAAPIIALYVYIIDKK